MAEMVCRCCHEKKMLTEFYRSGSGYMRRCKKCVSMDNKLRRWYESQDDEQIMYENWPDEILQIVKTFAEYYKAGGKVDYSNSPAPMLISVYAEHNPEAFVDTKAGASELDLAQIKVAIESTRDVLGDATDALLQLVDAIAQTNLRLGLVEGKKLSAESSSHTTSTGKANDPCFNPTGDNVQERNKLIRMLSKNEQLNDTFEVCDLQDLLNDINELFRSATTMHYVDPYAIRKITAIFENYRIPMPDELLVLYRKFIKPGLEATRLREDYSQLAEIAMGLTGINFYEEPWESIPHED